LRMARGRKAAAYARAQIADYWIVNLVDRVLEVYRQPAADTSAPYGWRYASIQTLGSASSIAPLAAPGARVRVSDLLP
jgi:Uma2 family endonuclease